MSFWIKIGLGLARQLEELLLPIHKTVPKPALLTTGFMCKVLEEETNTYLNEMTNIWLTFYEKLILESKKLLSTLNGEMTNFLQELAENHEELILAKAFRSAVASASNFFKLNYKEFQTPLNQKTTTGNVYKRYKLL